MQPINGKIAQRSSRIEKTNPENFNPKSGSETFFDGDIANMGSAAALGVPLGITYNIALNSSFLAAANPEGMFVTGAVSAVAAVTAAVFAVSKKGLRGQIVKSFNKHSSNTAKAGVLAAALALTTIFGAFASIATGTHIRENVNPKAGYLMAEPTAPAPAPKM